MNHSGDDLWSNVPEDVKYQPLRGWAAALI